jgi:hypothetical protein
VRQRGWLQMIRDENEKKKQKGNPDTIECY